MPEPGDSRRRVTVAHPALPVITPASGEEPPGLYLHIPFCLQKCGYCSFYSLTDRALIPDFLAALRREMTLYAKGAVPFDSVYILSTNFLS